MPRYVQLNALKGPLTSLVHQIRPPIPSNPLLSTPSPHQYFAQLRPSQIPPNVRIEWETVNSKSSWHGIGVVEKYGGRKTKDTGREWREGKGREARRKGGLKWALRER